MKPVLDGNNWITLGLELRKLPLLTPGHIPAVVRAGIPAAIAFSCKPFALNAYTVSSHISTYAV